MSFLAKVRTSIEKASAVVVILLGVFAVFSQSSDQAFPTPVTANEISASIQSRDVGDSRLTTHYYVLQGGQGDLFVNVVSKGFSGDIDIFSGDGSRPLTKIVLYGDLEESETGRVLYLRRPEKLILRVQGRTPGDEAATYRIKFGGSFVAMQGTEVPKQPELPTVVAQTEGGIRVNSVGTILPPAPAPSPEAPTPEIADDVAAAEPVLQPEDQVKVERTEPEQVQNPPESVEPQKKVEVIVTDPLVAAETAAPPPARRRRGRRPPPKETAVPDEAAEVKPETGSVAETSTKAADPMAGIHLVIDFKDGSKVTRPMNEVIRFSVDRGILTVVAKDGRTGRYAITTVSKVTIE